MRPEGDTGTRHDLVESAEPTTLTAGAATATREPMRILLVYATRHGSTREVADALAEELRAGGHEVDLYAAADAPGPAGYAAAVVGGPMIMGWHKEARRYVGPAPPPAGSAPHGAVHHRRVAHRQRRR